MKLAQGFAALSVASLLMISGLARAQDIRVLTFTNVEVPDGHTETSYIYQTQMGPTMVGNYSYPSFFFLTNQASFTPANITGPITVSGTNASDFIIGQPSVTNINFDSFVGFDITFNPSGPGTRTGTINIPTDLAGDKANYTFTVKGEGSEYVINDATNLQLSIPSEKRKVKASSKSQSVTVSWSTFIVNVGSLGSTGAKLKYYLSDDAFLSADDIVVGEKALKPVKGAREGRLNPVFGKHPKVKGKVVLQEQSGYIFVVLYPGPGDLINDPHWDLVNSFSFGVENPT